MRAVILGTRFSKDGVVGASEPFARKIDRDQSTLDGFLMSYTGPAPI